MPHYTIALLVLTPPLHSNLSLLNAHLDWVVTITAALHILPKLEMGGGGWDGYYIRSSVIIMVSF